MLRMKKHLDRFEMGIEEKDSNDLLAMVIHSFAENEIVSKEWQRSTSRGLM